MSLRGRITDLFVASFKSVCPSISGSDLSFFGGKADIVSPIFLKFRLDGEHEIVYNNGYTLKYGDSPLFSGIREESGFVSFTVSDEALGLMTDEAVRDLPEPMLPCVIETGMNPGYVIAKLMDFSVSGPAVSSVPKGQARRALWQCLTADTNESLSIAVKSAYFAAAAHRRASASGNFSDFIGRKFALAMAKRLAYNYEKK